MKSKEIAVDSTNDHIQLLFHFHLIKLSQHSPNCKWKNNIVTLVNRLEHANAAYFYETNAVLKVSMAYVKNVNVDTAASAPN